MKYFNIFVIIALISSLIMNFTLSSKLNTVENQLMNLSNNQQHILSSVNGQVDQVRAVMNDIQKQQSWISEITMDVKSEDSHNGKSIAIFNWQIKELPQNSKVEFHYAYGETDVFTSVPIEAGQNGLYALEVPLNIKFEPLWEVYLSETNQEESKKEFEERMDEENKRHTLRYFVSVTSNAVVKSSEVSTRHMRDFGNEYYGIVNVDVHMEADYTSIFMTNYLNNNIRKVYLLKYQNETLMDEEEMKSEDDHFVINRLEKDKATRFVLKVSYKNGETFEKEIYKK